MGTQSTQPLTGVRKQAVRRASDQAGEHGSRWKAIGAIAAKIGCAVGTLHHGPLSTKRRQPGVLSALSL
jgi:hypothetical protein